MEELTQNYCFKCGSKLTENHYCINCERHYPPDYVHGFNNKINRRVHPEDKKRLLERMLENTSLTNFYCCHKCKYYMCHQLQWCPSCGNTFDKVVMNCNEFFKKNPDYRSW
jgi:predicted amidophosphoribosyltransferase